MTREETSKYTDPMADGTARIFSFLMDARSLITYPAYPVTLSRGWVEINGIAWTGSGKIQRVDVSTDGGATWAPAKLQEPVLSKAHTRFRHLWNWTGGEAVIMSRAVDETGYVQPTRTDLIASRGVSSVGYHYQPDHRLARSRRMAPSCFDRSRGHEEPTPSSSSLPSCGLGVRRWLGGRCDAAVRLPRRHGPGAAEAAAGESVDERTGDASASAGPPRPPRSPRWTSTSGPMAPGFRPDAAPPPTARRSTRRAARLATARRARKGRTTSSSAASRATRFTFARDPRAPKTIGSYWPYATTVFDYIRRAMPPDAPGSLKRQRGLRTRRRTCCS